MKLMHNLKKLFIGVSLLLSAAQAAEEVSWVLPVTSLVAVPGFSEDEGTHRIVICSDKVYEERLATLKLAAADISHYPAPSYKIMDDSKLNITFREEKIGYVDQGIAKILKRPRENEFLITHSLGECVGIAIHTPELVACYHIDLLSLAEGKLERVLDRFPLNQRPSATVTLVSSYYSIILRQTINQLEATGFKNIALDIEPSILLQHPLNLNTWNYVQASLYGKSIEYFANLSQRSYQEIKSDLRTTKLRTPRALIIEAKTGQLWQIYSWEDRHRESYFLGDKQQAKEKQ